ncbi:MAG: MraY family glycosyltransferase [Bacteroidota bacterium]
MRNIDENQVRWASASKPALGGISFYIIFLFSVSFVGIVHSADTLIQNKQFLGILGTVTLAFMIGLADDAYNTRPYLKFSGQLTCGLLLASTGTYIHFFESDLLNYVVSVIWVIGIMNSINMLDNMDGITTNVSIFIIINAIVVLLAVNSFSSPFFLILIGLLGALIGFLYYNWNPSKIYMGDTGSQFLGALLGAVSIIYFWNTPFDLNSKIQLKQIVITALVFVLPIADTSTVVINRLLKKQSPFVGGKDHTTHHLSYLGFSDKQVALIFIAIATLSVIITFVISVLNIWNTLTVSLSLIYIISVVVGLYLTTKVKRIPKS